MLEKVEKKLKNLDKSLKIFKNLEKDAWTTVLKSFRENVGMHTHIWHQIFGQAESDYTKLVFVVHILLG